MKTKPVLSSLCLLIVFAVSVQTSKGQNVTDINGLKQGAWTEETGAFTASGNYADDLKDGLWISRFAENGLLYKVENYRKGLRQGLFLEFSKRSSLASEQNYENDLPHGVHRTYTLSGIPLSVQNYNNGKLHGVQITYYENVMDKKSEEASYNEGVKDGPSRWYDMQGNLIAEYVYSAGVLEGEQKSFYPGGKLQSVDTYVNNHCCPVKLQKSSFDYVII